MTDILATPQGKTIKLADGKDYTLSAFNLNTLANLEEAFDCDLEEIQGNLARRTATSFRKLLWTLLKENYPDMSLTDVGKLVELNKMTELVTELTGALGELST